MLESIKDGSELLVINPNGKQHLVLAHLDAEDGYTMIRDDLTPDEKRRVANMIMDWGWTV